MSDEWRAAGALVTHKMLGELSYEGLLRPEGEAAMKRRAAERRNDNVCHGEYGWPVVSLLAEPFKIVQAPKETLFVYEIDSLHRQVFTDGREFPATFEFPAYLGYSGRRANSSFGVFRGMPHDRHPPHGTASILLPKFGPSSLAPA